MKRTSNLGFAAVVAAIIFISAQQTYAVQVTITETLTIPGTAPFNSSLGTLESVKVTFDPAAVDATSSNGSHGHTIPVSSILFPAPDGLVPGDTVDLAPILMPDGGIHNHQFNLSAFTWNGLSVNFPSTTTEDGGGHALTVDFPEMVVDADGMLTLPPTATDTVGDHTHLVDLPMRMETYTGSALDLWVNGMPSSVYSIPNSFVNPVGNDTTFIPAGSYEALVNGTDPASIPLNFNTFSNAAGTHIHTLSFPEFEVVETTFTYSYVVPEPSSITLLGMGLLGLVGCVVRRSRRQS